MSRPATRLRPTAVDAERSLLGALLTEPERIPDVSAVVNATDFHVPHHAALFRLLGSLWKAGEPVDLVTVPMRIANDRTADRYGGLGYVVELPSACPSPQAAPNYAKAVRDSAIRRRLLELSEQLAERSTSGELDVSDVVAGVTMALGRLHDGQSHAHDVGTVFSEVVAKMDRVHRGTEPPALSTGYRSLDDALGGGCRPGELTILAARPGMGKAQPLDEPVMTPHGPVLMGQIRVGDMVLGRDGKPHPVLAVWPQGRKPVYRVEFSDGTRTRCCAEHLWTVSTRNGRRRGAGEEVVSLESMRGNLRVGGHWNYQIPVSAPVTLEPAGPLPMDPWLLGVLLGDGSLNKTCPGFTNSEPDIQERVRAALPSGDELVNAGKPNEFRIRGRATRRILNDMAIRCLSAEKHVPNVYLMASVEDRIALLQGLCDTDGHVADGGGGLVEWGSVSSRLREAFVWLVQSLGGRVSVKIKQPTYTYRGEQRKGQPFYRCYAWFTGVVPVSSRKHLARWTGNATMNQRVVDIVEVDADECQCLTVEGGEYLTRDFLVTHNTAVAMNVACLAATADPVGVFSMEMPRAQLVSRLIPMFSGVPLDRVVDARKMDDRDWSRVVDAGDQVAALQLLIDDTPALRLAELQTRARAMVARGAKLIVVDYLGKMYVDGRDQVREIGRNVSGLKDLARSEGVPVLCLAQLNRGVEARSKKTPTLADLRDSGEVEQEADAVVFVYREAVYDDSADPSALDLVIAKARMGRLGTVRMSWNGPLQLVNEEEGPL